MVKICGLKTRQEALWVSEQKVEFAGMVLFFPKSKRNISIDQAMDVMSGLSKSTKAVAVCVLPVLEQIRQIEAAGFDYLQFHGHLEKALLDEINIPVIKAFNVKDMSDFRELYLDSHIAGFVFDANNPGSGSGFDYSLLENIKDEVDMAKRNGKFVLLAGGLGPENVADALKATGFDSADTSSGVENEEGTGKDKIKIANFVQAVRNMEGK